MSSDEATREALSAAAWQRLLLHLRHEAQCETDVSNETLARLTAEAERRRGGRPARAEPT